MSKAYIFSDNLAADFNIYTWGVAVNDVTLAANDNTAYTVELGPDGNGDFTLGLLNVAGLFLSCIGIARHNIRPGAIINVEYQVVNGGPWITFNRLNPADRGNQAAIWLFPGGNYYAVRMRVQQNGPFNVNIGYFFAGNSTELPVDLFVGHVPFPFARQTKVAGGLGNRGDYLGTTVERVDYTNTIDLKNIKQDDMRSIFLPLIRNRKPFYFAQNYVDRPDEVAFCWLLDDPQVTNSRPNGMMDISLTVGAIY